MIKIYNTRTKKKEEFKPCKEGEVSMYVCGPTVYDLGHLGHGRSAVAFDVIRKYFEYKGFKVKFVSNYTDIDDKMINRAREEKISVDELAMRIIPGYERDYGDLGIKRPDVQPRATEHIKEIIDLIKLLEEKGFTYVLNDGVYYDVSKFKDYGKLSGQNLDELKMGARVQVKEEKKHPYDFVLWKFKKEGEPAWASPWGEGRPGWHIECSAMTWKHLGENFDIHGGGLDLTFPHHECEVAQSCAAFGKDAFAKYWIHNGFIQVDNEKMSKSLGNFFTLKDIFKKYDPQVVRFMFLQTHYRNPINFSDVLLEQAKVQLDKLQDFYRRMLFFSSRFVSKLYPNYNAKAPLNYDTNVSEEVIKLVEDAYNSFKNAMDDDFNTSGALGAISIFITSINSLVYKKKFTLRDYGQILDFLRDIDLSFSIITTHGILEIDQGLEQTINLRDKFRDAKNFAMADSFRDEIAKKGVLLEDTPNGTIWKKL